MGHSSSGPTTSPAIVSASVDIAQLGRAADMLVERGRTDLAVTLIEAIFVLSPMAGPRGVPGEGPGDGMALPAG
jgi:hypothetical protein